MVQYSPKGSNEFNKQLDQNLLAMAEKIQAVLKDTFIALILAGGYGKKEGACVLREGKESLYNDLDLFLVVTKNMDLPSAVSDIAKTYEHIFGVDVDIAKPITVKYIQQLPAKLMFKDLYYGHTVILGPSDIITANAPVSLQQDLPQVEALHLMLNRGSGLLQAIIESQNLKNGKPRKDDDFVRRNYQKCTLAFGDSLLITHKCYTPALNERLSNLTKEIKAIDLPQASTILALYEQAVQFKLSPDTLVKKQPEQAVLLDAAKLWVDILLYEEARRTKKEWKTASEYAQDRFIRETEQHKGKNLVRNLYKNIKNKQFSFRYPREILYGQLSNLLDHCAYTDPSWLKESQIFLERWTRYN